VHPIEANPPPHQLQPLGPPRWLFILEAVYLLVLLVVFVSYIEWSGFNDSLPETVGGLPVGVPWFGAVGGVLISLTGIFLHARDWDMTYTWWHVARPLIGAVVGSIGCLILVVVVEATSTNRTHTNASVYYLAAFLVGYREETFRELIKRATDVIFGAGRSPASRKRVISARDNEREIERP
jgi:hypothetical protein